MTASNTERRALHVGAALTLALSLPSLAGAAHLDLSFVPEAPVWDESVVLRVEGGDDCAIHELSEPELGFDSTEDRHVIDVDLLLDACPGTNPPVPFAVETDLGRLFPLDWLVRVHDGGEVTSAELTVYRRADLDLLSVPSSATDEESFVLPVTGIASSPCFGLDGPFVDGDVVEFLFIDNCPILPPGGPNVFTEPFEVGPLAAGEYEVRLFESNPVGSDVRGLTKRSVIVHDADGCVPSETALCLQDGRFRVEVAWRDFRGRTGVGHAVPLEGRLDGRREGREDTGLFWFFREANIELTVKVLRGCRVNGHFWVFISSGSTVEYEITVTDTLAEPEVTRTYRKDLHEIPSLLADTAAFGCSQP